MMIKTMQWLILFLPWLTLFAARKGFVRRLMPSVVFTCLTVTIVFIMGYTFKWWTIHEYIVPWGNIVDVSFTYGIFAVGTFWIFYFTGRSFLLFVLVNALVDAIFSFAILPLMERIKIITMGSMPLWQTYLLNLTVMLIIYAYHRWQTAGSRTNGNGPINRPSFTEPSHDWGIFSRRRAR